MEKSVDNKNYFELNEVLVLIRKNEEETVWEVTDTPFMLLRKEARYYLTVGKYAIEECEGIDDAIQKTREITYDRILKLILIAIEQKIDEKNARIQK